MYILATDSVVKYATENISRFNKTEVLGNIPIAVKNAVVSHKPAGIISRDWRVQGPQ
jgi:hypothetical protein